MEVDEKERVGQEKRCCHGGVSDVEIEDTEAG